MQVLINLSNHRSNQWGEKQLAAASAYGKVIDLPFPQVDPYGDSAYIDGLVEQYLEEISQYGTPTVMVQGESVFAFRMVMRLKARGIKGIAACSERRTIEQADSEGRTTKKSEFEFAGFREY